MSGVAQTNRPQVPPRPNEVPPPPMREVTKGWFTSREREVSREALEKAEEVDR